MKGGLVFKITVTYLNHISYSVGVKNETMDIEGIISLQDLLSVLTQKHGDKFSHLVLDEEGYLLPYVKVILNDKIVCETLNHRLQDNDQVCFLLAIAGG